MKLMLFAETTFCGTLERLSKIINKRKRKTSLSRHGLASHSGNMTPYFSWFSWGGGGRVNQKEKCFFFCFVFSFATYCLFFCFLPFLPLTVLNYISSGGFLGIRGGGLGVKSPEIISLTLPIVKRKKK